MLAPHTKQSLNMVIDRMGILDRVEWDSAATRVDLRFRLSLENESIEPADEYWEWPSRYVFRLTGVGRIFISPHKENVPPELTLGQPSEELMAFLLRTFENQGIYEWTTFENPVGRFAGAWSSGWNYQNKHFSDALDFACVFKERGVFPHTSACWVAGFWFQELEILEDLRESEVLPVDVLVSRYQPYAARIQP